MKPISKNTLSVRILFMCMELDVFTISEAIEEFHQRHKVELKFSRMSQILDEFHQDGLLTKETLPKGKKNKLTHHFKFNPLPNGTEQHSGETGTRAAS